jgi:hypothetical protein
MNGKKLLIAALSSTLLVGAAATASFAAPGDHHGPRHHGMHGPHRMGPPPEVIYVQLVKKFDTNGDMKVSKDELKAGVDKTFDAIDANHDGQITPAELKTYRQDQMKAWRDAHKDDKAKGDAMKADDQKPGDQKPGDGDQAAGEDHGPGGDHHGRHGHWMRGRMMEVMMFSRIDKDGSGQISKQEAEDFANKVFDRLDRNHDGVLSIDDMPDHPFL